MLFSFKVHKNSVQEFVPASGNMLYLFPNFSIIMMSIYVLHADNSYVGRVRHCITLVYWDYIFAGCQGVIVIASCQFLHMVTIKIFVYRIK